MPTNCHVQLLRVLGWSAQSSSSSVLGLDVLSGSPRDGARATRRRSVSLSEPRSGSGSDDFSIRGVVAGSMYETAGDEVTRQYETHSFLSNCSVTAVVTMGAPVAHSVEALPDGLLRACEQLVCAPRMSFLVSMALDVVCVYGP